MATIRGKSLPTWFSKNRTCDVGTFRLKNGRNKGECTWCGGPMPGRRYHWCSDECVFEFDVRYVPSGQAIAVHNRDKGICAECGDDMKGLRENIALIRQAIEVTYWTYSQMDPFYRLIGLPYGRVGLRLWDVDHIVPVIEGGAKLGLANLRTLCFWCHKLDTAKLAARRAAFRRLERDIERRKLQPVLFETEENIA